MTQVLEDSVWVSLRRLAIAAPTGRFERDPVPWTDLDRSLSIQSQPIGMAKCARGSGEATIQPRGRSP
jgi:hypothetical protein